MTRTDNSGSDRFAFRKHDNVGNAAAEEDTAFLDECFVDTGDIAFLLDNKNSKRIIVGRTGAGKSALIYQLSQLQKKVIRLSPHDLSLNFIASNKVIAFFEAAGVNLSPFYILLWKHLLVVELLKAKYHINNESAHAEFMRRIKETLYKKDKMKEQAVEYLEQWGDKFWLTTQQRIHEITERVQSGLTAGVGTQFAGINFSVEGAKKLTVEQRQEIVEHGLDAVSKVQIRELDNMIAVLAENVFNDSKDIYYVVIDMLDEDWADERIKFKLIRALIDTVRRFMSVPNIKIILALRQDLLDKVIYFEVVPGFQEEKYKALYLQISWNKEGLKELVEKRINTLIRRRYTKGDISFSDVFVSNIDGQETLEYMLDRTFYRPRDIIVFVNECLGLSDGRPNISAAIVKKAEERYSSERLQSLANEWSTIYPNLYHTAQFFHGLHEHTEVSQITPEFISDRYAEAATEITNTNSDPITRALDGLFMKDANFGAIRNFVLREFYVTGLIGIKTGPTASTSWSRLTAHARLSAGEVKGSSIVCIHPMFYRALGVKLPQ